MISPIIELLIENAQRYPDKVAIVEGNKSVTYNELLILVKRKSAVLKKSNINCGDTILVYVPMSIALYVNLLGIWYRGAVAVFVDAWTSKNRLDYVAEFTQSKAFIGIPKAFLFTVFSKKVRAIPIKIMERSFLMSQNYDLDRVPESVEGNRTALVTFTTGSTGVPKGANRTHDFLMAQHNTLKEHLKLSSDDVDLTTLPIFLLNNLGMGITSVIAPIKHAKPEALSPKKVIHAIRKYSVTTTAGSPIVYETLARYIQQKSIFNLTLKKIFIGGAPVFPRLANTLRDSFPSARIEVVYGSTEVEPISSCSIDSVIQHSDNLLEKGLCVGTVDSHIQLAVVSPESICSTMNENTFTTACVSEAAVGEICVSGNHVLSSYYNNPVAEKENKINVSGTIWHRTGDCGYLLHNTLFLMGRLQQIIVVDGSEYFTFPMEQVLAEIPGIKRATILQNQGDLHTVIEPVPQADRSLITQQVKAIEVLNTSKIHYRVIPKDPRHNSKTDYDSLKKHLGL
ncbi:MAG: AMP-binding protein [Fibrobacterales bacterium]